MPRLKVEIDASGNFPDASMQMLARDRLDKLRAQLEAEHPLLFRFSSGPAFTRHPDGTMTAEWSYKKVGL